MHNNPNIIYILADDMGYGDLSCLNNQSKINTRFLDQLAAEGMIFRDAHASSAVCTPSRYSILTGRYNWRSTLKEGVTWGYSGPIIEPGRMTVASYLQQHGYQTACFGKWHLGWEWAKQGTAVEEVDYTRPIENGPTSRGFDTFFGIGASLDMPPYVYVENENVTAVPDQYTNGREGKQLWRAGPIAPDFKHEEVLPRLTARVLDAIDQMAQEVSPFFIYFPLPAPHTPMLPTAQFQGQSGTNEYGDFCLQVDDVVGQIMQALDLNGLSENSIIIFASDNGAPPSADFQELAAFDHYPSYLFRGHKADIYEGGHRIPLLIRWPGTIKAGSACDETVCLSDLLATCADILGEDLPPNAGEDSVSNLPLWLGAPLDEPLREATVHTSIDGSLSIRQGHWKLEMCPGSGGWSFPRPGPESAGLPPIQLYDLQADIGERHNLEQRHPDIVQHLQELLTDYVRNGRSTPGPLQENDGETIWKQLWWMDN
ncbi:MAG: arylsulfatase [Anaerolineaceae bacterium]|nr:MAG: arylsulfatase [Anaerolineaceae bacterium]